MSFSLFNQNDNSKNTSNNQNNGGLFGNNNNNNQGGLFGNNNKSIFGNNTNNNQQSLFGNSNNKNQSNGQVNNQTGGLFGNNNQGGGLFGNNNNNQGGGLFGNNNSNNQGGGLFGNNNNNNKQGGGLFGNNNNNQGGGLFGNNNNNQGGGLFGSNNNSQGGGLFGNNNNNQGGGLFGNNNNNNQGGGLFSNTNNQGGGLFGNNNNQGGGLFNNNNNNQVGGEYNNNNSNYPLRVFYSQTKPLLALNPHNELRNIQINQLPQNIQTYISQLKLRLMQHNNKIADLEGYLKRLGEYISQNNISFNKFEQLINFINQKLNHYEGVVNQINDNYKNLSKFYEAELYNIQLMERQAGYKVEVEVPSKYLLDYSQNLYNKTLYFQKRINDIVTLLKVYFNQNNQNIHFDNDLIESTMAEFLKICKELLMTSIKQEKMIEELFQKLTVYAINNGENPEYVRKNILNNNQEFI